MKRILVVDDEPSIVMIMEEFLSEEGYEVHTAMDGDKALAMVDSEIPFDLALVDLRIPGVSGKEIIHKIRQTSRLEGMPIIVITGFEKNSEDFPPENSYQSLFTKPFMLEDILEEIQRLSN